MEQSKWYRGKVTHGFQNGRKFGFPTANIIDIQPNEPICTGIYAVIVKINDEDYFGMMYVGTRPTLSLSTYSIEIHIFDFNEDLYNQSIQFSISKKMREERHFSSIAELMAQLNEDERVIRQYFRQQ